MAFMRRGEVVQSWRQVLGLAQGGSGKWEAGRHDNAYLSGELR